MSLLSQICCVVILAFCLLMCLTVDVVACVVKLNGLIHMSNESSRNLIAAGVCL